MVSILEKAGEENDYGEIVMFYMLSGKPHI